MKNDTLKLFAYLNSRGFCMEWSEYIVSIAAPHSKGSAKLWFRYLRKHINECGVLFSIEDVEALYRSDSLTPFQRVSLKAAFEEGSHTRAHILSLNSKAQRNRIMLVREKYENSLRQQ